MREHWTVDVIGTDSNPARRDRVDRVLLENWSEEFGEVRLKVLPSSEPAVIRKFLGQTVPDLVLVSACAPQGTDWPELDVIRNFLPGCPIIAVVPELPPAAVLRLFQEGIADFVVPPVRPADLLPRVKHCLLRKGHVDRSTDELKRVLGIQQMIGQSPAFVAQLAKLQKVSACGATVLIRGETGTGKELFARAVHYLSRRSAGPFVAVNCGAIPADLMENELFGHARGAFTGAISFQQGLLQEASAGSLFLDEIDSLGLPLQAKLLRMIQEKEYRPLGAGKAVRADARMIVASNNSLEEAVRLGRFRADLYYRINVVSLHLPSLRSRGEDIGFLAQHFVTKYATEFGRPARCLTLAAIHHLESYSWPGNVRELENVILRAVLECDSESVFPEMLDLPVAGNRRTDGSFRSRKARVIEDFERDYLTTVLLQHAGNISAAARTAKKNRRAFWQLLRKYGLLSGVNRGFGSPPRQNPGAQLSVAAPGAAFGPIPSAYSRPGGFAAGR